MSQITKVYWKRAGPTSSKFRAESCSKNKRMILYFSLWVCILACRGRRTCSAVPFRLRTPLWGRQKRLRGGLMVILVVAICCIIINHLCIRAYLCLVFKISVLCERASTKFGWIMRFHTNILTSCTYISTIYLIIFTHWNKVFIENTLYKSWLCR